LLLAKPNRTFGTYEADKDGASADESINNKQLKTQKKQAKAGSPKIKKQRIKLTTTVNFLFYRNLLSTESHE